MPSVVLFASSGACATTDGTMPAMMPPTIAKNRNSVRPAEAAGGTPRFIMPRVGGHSMVATTIASATGRTITHIFSMIQPMTSAPAAITTSAADHFASASPPEAISVVRSGFGAGGLRSVLCTSLNGRSFRCSRRRGSGSVCNLRERRLGGAVHRRETHGSWQAFGHEEVHRRAGRECRGCRARVLQFR